MPSSLTYTIPSGTTSGQQTGTPVSPPYAFTGIGIGTPSADRLVQFNISWGHATGGSGTNGSIYGITCNGTLMNVDADSWLTGNTTNDDSIIASLLVPTGTTATFVVNFDAGWIQEFIFQVAIITGNPAIAAVGNYEGIPPQIPAGIAGVSDATETVSIPSGGLMTMCAIDDNDNVALVQDWTGADNSISIIRDTITSGIAIGLNTASSSGTVSLHCANSGSEWGWIGAVYPAPPPPAAIIDGGGGQTIYRVRRPGWPR